VLVAGAETKESLSTWPRAAAAQSSGERERERERERGGGVGNRDAADGRGRRVHRRRNKIKRSFFSVFF